LEGLDGALVFGSVLRDLYLRRGWARRVHVWHEAADVRTFRPLPARKEGDLAWIGNWGDEERSAELREFLIEPVSSLRLRARVHGVRYPPEALEELRGAGIEHGGWLPNFRVPEVLAQHRVTIHVPRRPYARALPGVPTIRPFEALACRVPLVCAPWEDAEGLFSRGRDFWMASNGGEMARHLRQLLNEPEAAQALAEHGHATLLSRHTCAHRVDELLTLVGERARGERTASA
jgi:spore maturation protein CgeB